MEVIDLGDGETKPFNGKSVAACVRYYICFQKNQCFHLYGNLTMFEPVFGNMTIFGIHVEFLNTYKQEGEKKDVLHK